MAASSQQVGSRGVYEYITEYNSSGYNGRASIDAIVIHWWDDPANAPTFWGVLKSLLGQRDASANYVVEQQRVACIVAPGLRAWHVRGNDFGRVMTGIADINSHSIGIECNPRCSAADQETLAQLIADLWADYGRVPIYGHCDFMATMCPGSYYPLLAEIERRAEEIYNGEEQPIMARYQTLAEVPDYAAATITKLVNAGIIAGDGSGLDLSADMCRVLVWLDRLGLFDA